MPGSSRIHRLRRQQGFEWAPPICASCQHFKRRMDHLPLCTLGNFAVRRESCCDRWTDRKTGETVAEAPAGTVPA